MFKEYFSNFWKFVKERAKNNTYLFINPIYFLVGFIGNALFNGNLNLSYLVHSSPIIIGISLAIIFIPLLLAFSFIRLVKYIKEKKNV